MNAKTSTSEIVPESALANLQLLSRAQRQQVFDFVAFLAQQPKITDLVDSASGKNSEILNKERQFSRKQIFGCLDGRISISDDFDAPLDDFAEYI
jgi:Protein of unknown function (DUF2281)